jgi:hypothetical protein
MEGGSGSGCACCSCGCLLFFIAIIVAIVMVFALFVPMNNNYGHVIPDDFQEYSPDINDGSVFPSVNRPVRPIYELSESSAKTCGSFRADI